MSAASSAAAGGRLPDFIVIGAMKCGTSSLRHYLGLHPEVFVWGDRGLDFFLEEYNWARGADWYRAQFAGPARIFGEVSPRYTNAPFARGVAERMHALVPDAKLVYVVRDPIERLLSHWVHARAYGRERHSLPVALRDLEHNPYVWRSRYALQLAPFLARYPRERVLVTYQEDLRVRRSETMARVYGFLGVDASFTSARFTELKHRSADLRRETGVGRLLRRVPLARRLADRPPLVRPVARPRLPPGLRVALRALFRDDMRRIAELAGRPLPGWDDAF